ncbi:MAG: DUF374 domain-containing protein [Verrucomicrobia bacterium]|nr:DUF374 domain-containing protein [Verrucomicrobiota bacterium]
MEPETVRVIRAGKRFLAEKSPPLIAALIRLLGGSLRYRLEDPQGLLLRQPDSARIWAFWHNRILMMPYLYEKFCPGRKMLMLVSRSRDGEFITRIMNRFGIEGARGSSSKGGAEALRELFHELDRPRGRDIGITPDGPRGPRLRVQDGVLALAAGTGRSICPVTVRYDHCWELPSWDRFQIPRPGAVCRVIVGPAVAAPKGLQPAELDRARGELERALGD